MRTYWPIGSVRPLWSKPPGPQILLSIISVPTLPLSPTNRLFFISCLEPSSYGKVPPLQGEDVWGERSRGSFPRTQHTTGDALTWPGSGQCRCQRTWGQEQTVRACSRCTGSDAVEGEGGGLLCPGVTLQTLRGGAFTEARGPLRTLGLSPLVVMGQPRSPPAQV